MSNPSSIHDLDPATGNLIEEIPCATEPEVVEAVGRAQAAQKAWADLSFAERAACLLIGAEKLAQRVDPIAELIVREMGKPLEEARREVKGWGRYVAELLEEVEGALAPEVLASTDCETRLVREPHGVVAAITPWNFPIGMPLQILVPALAAGNTVVFKPSEHVPLVGRAIFDAFGPAVPPGVLGFLQGDGAVGAALVAAEVDMIAFVGSRETGIAIMENAASGLKRLVLELGGKDPLVIFADADLDAAAECAVRHSLRNTGQVCCSVERVYIEETAAEEFERLVVAKAEAWRHGSGFDGDSKMGPLVSDRQRERVVQQVEDARQRGARLLMGGEVPAGPGFFYPATVIAGCASDMAIIRDETFGPVVCIASFDGSEKNAVELANDTPFGLGANVYTGDLERGTRVAEGIRSGQVGINRYLGSAPGVPWVGARQSGFGFLGGVDGHRQFTTPKSISVTIEADGKPVGS